MVPDPVCGDGPCDLAETQCGCPEDCGLPPSSETSCSNGADEDCDGLVDCADPDCGQDAACTAADCSMISDKKACNAEPTCRWDNRGKLCLDS